MPHEPLNPQPGQYSSPGKRYRESMGGAIAAIQDLVAQGGGVPRTYPSNWGGLIRAIQDLGTSGFGGGGSSQIIAGRPLPNWVLPPAGSPPGTPGNWGSPSTPPTNGTLWYDDLQGRLMVWLNGAFYQTNGAESMVHVGPEPPKDVNGLASNRLGAIWFDTRQGRTFTLIESASGNKEWYQLNGEESQTVFVEPHRRRSYYFSPSITFTEDASGTFGVIDDPAGALGTLKSGDSIRGLSSNGGGIIESVTGTTITLSTLNYRSQLTASENIEIARIYTPGQISSFTPDLLTPTYNYDTVDKSLSFAAGVPAEIQVGYFVTDQAYQNGGQVARIIDSNSDGVPDKVFLAPINFIGDLADNVPLAIKNYHSQAAKIGDMWFRTDTGDMAVYNGSTWIVIGGGGGGGSEVLISDSAPNGTGLNLDATYGTPGTVDGTLWFDKQRQTTYVSVDDEWQPLTDRKYRTQTILANNAGMTPIYETTADKHGFFVDYVVMDKGTSPQIVNAGRILVYHVGPEVSIVNVMAQGLDSSGQDTQMGVTFSGAIDALNNTFKLECVCDNNAGVVLANPPVIQIAVSNWVDPL